MSQQPRPPYWQLVKAAVEEVGGKTTNAAVRDWILARFPDAKVNTIAAQTVICTVNSPSRVHFPENQKERLVDGSHRYDSLFRPERGRLELFDPKEHGLWRIAKREDGKLEVRPATEDTTDAGAACPEDARRHAFAAEDHMRDYLAKHLDLLEDGLALYVDDEGNGGVEYLTPVGRIDILAVDAGGGLVVIELKSSRAPDAACGQIMRYLGWVRRHLGRGKKVRGFIIAHHFSDKIRYAVADIPGVVLKQYELSVDLHDVPSIDEAQTVRQYSD